MTDALTARIVSVPEQALKDALYYARCAEESPSSALRTQYLYRMTEELESALASSLTPAPAEAELEAWANIPPEIVQLVCSLGPVDWSCTVAQSPNEHGQDDEPRGMNMVTLEGTDIVLACTGTSPHSGTTASALAGAWNVLVRHCHLQAQALADAPGEGG